MTRVIKKLTLLSEFLLYYLSNLPTDWSINKLDNIFDQKLSNHLERLLFEWLNHWMSIG